MAIVTLTSDFGYRDGYVGAVKGVLLSMCPGVTIVDVAHGVDRGDVRGGAFALAQAAPYYPAGTVHLAVVDPGVGTDRAAIVVEAGNHLFVGPDNGLLSMAAPLPRRVWRIERRPFRREPVSATFHGRDVFAPAAARLAGGWKPSDAGPETSAFAELAPVSAAGGDRVVVVHVDAFGNLITSLSVRSWAAGTWTIRRGQSAWTARAVRTYADVGSGEMLVYAGSAGYLEVGVRGGSAAERIGVRVGEELELRRAE